MSNRNASKNMIGNPVISLTNGEKIAKVEDVNIDPNTLQAAAVLTSKGTLLNREMEGIPAMQVEVWGQDAVLVKRPDAIVKEEELGDRSGWLSASDDISGYDVVGEDGTRIGTLGDIVFDGQGQLMGYELADVAIEGRIAVSHWIDAKATRSLGPDVLIVKSEFV
jgi:uncharacterized protein YrrD